MPDQEKKAPPSQSYTLDDIKRWLGEREIQKGRAYIKRVSQLNIRAQSITALVQGSEYTPYHVHIEFISEPRRRYIATDCSCPVGLGCKHAAATLLAALEQPKQLLGPNPEVIAWAESLLKTSKQQGRKTPTQRSTIALHYLFGLYHRSDTPRLALLKGRIVDGKSVGSTARWTNIEQALEVRPGFINDEDYAILRNLLPLSYDNESFWSDDLPLDQRMSPHTLQQILATGRAWFHVDGKSDYTPLRPGEPRRALLAWEEDEYGQHHAILQLTPTAPHMMQTQPLWYLDPVAGEAGPIDCGNHRELIMSLLQLPPLARADLPILNTALKNTAPELPRPGNETAQTITAISAPVSGQLSFGTITARNILRHRSYSPHYQRSLYDYALPLFRYGDLLIPLDEKSEFFVDSDGNTVQLQRRPKEEKALRTALEHAGLRQIPQRAVDSRELPSGSMGLESEEAWHNFFGTPASQLRKAGWQLDIAQDFRHYHQEVSAWEMEFSGDKEGWLDLDMGIVVEGKRLALAPLLYSLFRRDARWLDADSLASIKDREQIILTTEEGERIGVEAERIKPLARILIDLFDAPPGATLRLPRLDATRLAELANQERWQFHGRDELLQLAERLRHAGKVKAVTPPKGLGLTLRPYQREGIAWLQHLREQQLGGILADDMGLGKTAQTLAHLLLEKEAGRLDRPVLAILPTSLIFNWQREAERYAPALRVLSLHGKERSDAFANIPEHDLCLTTYPLLWRDEKELTAHQYHMVILDEAQSVKNALSRAAGVIRKLDTRHRLCLTGTPLENHLGEMWSQFDFLLPGFLGDQRQFTRQWRTPIEKEGDTLRRDLLARRIAPFILRRRKEDVAKELPPKTVVVRNVELEGGQRDLYETVRSTMDKRIRKEIASRGFNRSQIVILDALLKLRQVCCDPRLLDTPAARRVKEHAKLEQLMEMVPELLEEGRRILIFSQFTSMLTLIEAELEAAEIPYTLLTGRTRKREEAIRRFQEGEVPLFLISLKAGGVGLNLTAADTVIHFDPWWNPAAENQATDRAHRIGQKKRVFVYKLVVAGSIEERIVALQEKKADLAAGILGEDASALAKFSESDIDALLAPLPK